MTARLHLVIRGRVQGVFYRASAQKEAEALGLHGWVRNRPDGSVELLAEGPKEDLERLVTWCRRGPEHAQVQSVETLEPLPGDGELTPFHVRR